MSEDRSKLFKDMAERITRAIPEEFGGAVVIVPPTMPAQFRTGEPLDDPIVFLMTDPTQDLVQFWSTLKSRVDVSVAKIEGAARDQQAGNAWSRR